MNKSILNHNLPPIYQYYTYVHTVLRYPTSLRARLVNAPVSTLKHSSNVTSTLIGVHHDSPSSTHTILRSFFSFCPSLRSFFSP